MGARRKMKPSTANLIGCFRRRDLGFEKIRYANGNYSELRKIDRRDEAKLLRARGKLRLFGDPNGYLINCD
jgi:hypothetical protein